MMHFFMPRESYINSLNIRKENRNDKPVDPEQKETASKQIEAVPVR